MFGSKCLLRIYCDSFNAHWVEVNVSVVHCDSTIAFLQYHRPLVFVQLLNQTGGRQVLVSNPLKTVECGQTIDFTVVLSCLFRLKH